MCRPSTVPARREWPYLTYAGAPCAADVRGGEADVPRAGEQLICPRLASPLRPGDALMRADANALA